MKIEKMNCLFLLGKSRYDVLKGFFRGMISGLESKGHCVDVLDANIADEDVEDYIRKREEIVRNHYDLVFTINGMLLEGQKLLKEVIKDDTRYVTMIVDHPAWHHERIKTKCSNVTAFFVDYNHVKYVKKYYPHISEVYFLPHGGAGLEKVIPYAERKYEVTFLGSYHFMKEIVHTLESYPPQMRSLILSCAEKMIKDTLLTF